MLKYTFDISKRRGCSIKTFTIRETDGKDETLAAVTAKAKGEGASMLEELARLSIVEVDGRPVSPESPADMDSWNTRTRTFVLNAFRHINGIDDEEGKDFLSQAKPTSAV